MSPKSRLQSVRIVVDEPTRRSHLDAIDRAVAEAYRRRRHGRVLAVAVAVVLLLPVVALAAERAEPGDFLYPIRQLLGRPLDVDGLADAGEDLSQEAEVRRETARHRAELARVTTEDGPELRELSPEEQPASEGPQRQPVDDSSDPAPSRTDGGTPGPRDVDETRSSTTTTTIPYREDTRRQP